MSDRHPKWVPVEPGTVIPAGQPYRVEWDGSDRQPSRTGLSAEYNGKSTEWELSEFFYGFYYAGFFVDSSWRPPLELPTEPTWGIAVIFNRGTDGPYFLVEKLRLDHSELAADFGRRWQVDRILDFIPLTPEQVARIEGQ